MGGTIISGGLMVPTLTCRLPSAITISPQMKRRSPSHLCPFNSAPNSWYYSYQLSLESLFWADFIAIVLRFEQIGQDDIIAEFNRLQHTLIVHD